MPLYVSSAGEVFALFFRDMAFPGVFAPVLAKHTKHLRLVGILAVGVDRMLNAGIGHSRNSVK